VPDIPREATEAATAVLHQGGDVAAMLAAALPHLVAADRLRLAEKAEGLAFTLWRPGNGPGAGEQAMRVVPLNETLRLMGGE
jgi:hypothetical protein